MTPIIDLQRRLREAGRIRIGEKVATGNGRARPGKLDAFRFTSSDERSIRAIANLYGGEVQRWSDAPVGEQWEVFTSAKALDVIVPPVDLAFSQWMELWAGGGCVRRCDGQTNVIDNSPCVCDPDAPACKPTTRLGVMLTALEGIGMWRVELHGWNGAQELLGATEVLRSMQARGTMVPARLLLEQRQSKRDGKTFNFAVPVLDLNLNVATMLGVPQGDVPHVTPVPRLDAPLTLAEQLAAVDAPERLKPSQRANAAAALPASGLKPRTVQQADEPVVEADNAMALRRLRAMVKGNAYIAEVGEAAWATAYLGRTVADLGNLSVEDIDALAALIRSGAINSAASVTNPATPATPAVPTYNPNEEPF